MVGSLSSVSSHSSFSSGSLDRQVVGRSMEWMRRANGWATRQSLRSWNPWTNEIVTSPTRHPQQQMTNEISDALTMTTKSAGSVYDLILSREQAEQQLAADSNSELASSYEAPPSKPTKPNSNTNNKNPFSLPDRSGAGLRDIQRHKADGKQTTIITQFKAAESNQDGKVDINIIMDSESNMSNAQDEFSDEADATTDTESKDGGGGGADGADGADASGGGNSGSPSDDEGVGGDSGGGGGGETGATPSTAGSSDGEVGGPPTAEGADGEEGDAGEGDADDSDAGGDDLPAPGEEKKDNKSEKKKLSMGHLDKEGIVIGCMNVFADVSKKEYVVLLTDSVVEAFLVDPGQFRSIAKRTGCEIEVTRRILNRRIGMYRWVKYLVVTLRGPNLMAIDQCDRLMVKMFPPYKIRKPYPEPAQVALFVKESYPDNSDLYFNYQRTGPTSAKVGDLALHPPFGKTPSRPIETTPWKQANPRLLHGILEPRNLPMSISVEHVYPEWGTEKCSFMDASCKWEQAGDQALDIEKKNNLERSMRVKQRKLGAEPLYAGGD